MKKTTFTLIVILCLVGFKGHANRVVISGGDAAELSNLVLQFSHIVINGEVTIDDYVEIPEGVMLEFRISGKFNILSGKTVELNGVLRAGLYQIFDGEGNVIGDPKVEKLYPQWWGANGTDALDDSEAIQAAINLGNTVYLPYENNGVPSANRYFVRTTLDLQNNTELVGEPGVVIRGKYTVENGGGYPNTIISAEGKKNISIRNIIFDFDKSRRVSFVDGTSKTGIHFNNCSNISLEDVTLQQFMTNFDTSNSKFFAVAVFENSKDIRINNLIQTQIIEEGIRFYDCKNINITNSTCTAFGLTTSTFFSFWRSDGVVLKNTRVNASETGGSVVNSYSRNVLIENLRMFHEKSDGIETYGGRGIDLSNEGQDILYDCYNITIRNCYLKCKRYGIQGGAYPSSEGTDILTIENNVFDIQEDGGFLQGIRIDDAKTATISNNRIILSDALSSSTGKCIWISSSSAGDQISKGIKIENNDMRGLSGVTYNGSSSIDLNLLSIKNNLFTAQTLHSGLSSNSGAGNFVFIRQLSDESPLSFDNIVLENNVVDNIGGGLFVVNATSNVSFGSISILRNTFRGGTDGTNSDTFIRIPNDTLSIKSSVLRIEDNNFYNPHSMKISNVDNIFISKNLFEWTTDTPAPVSIFRIQNCKKTLNIKQNIIMGAENNLGRVDVQNFNSTVNPKFTSISENVTVQQNGNLRFRIDNGFENTVFTNNNQ